MKNFDNLLKDENPQVYKQIAETGVMLAYPAKIKGQSHRPDINIPYHVTVKMFDPEKDDIKDVHNHASQLHYPSLDPSQMRIEPAVMKDRYGNDTYAIKLLGPHQTHIRENRTDLAHLGFPNHSVDHPIHVTVDKDTWHKVVSSGAKTADQAGFEFGPAQLRQGKNVLATYAHTHKPQDVLSQKLAASEKPEGEPLEKGAARNALTALGIAGAIAAGSPTPDAIPASPTVRQQQANTYSPHKMLNAIADVESSGGKFVNHRMLGGMHQGEKAYGKYGLTPVVIRETINMHRDLKRKHKKAIGLHGSDLHHYMQDNPGLEDEIASRHLHRLEHHFGQDPASIGHAWLEGIAGTYQARRKKEDLHDHWHVKKIKSAYLRRM